MWAQAGIDVVFFPVQSYNSPANTIDPSWNNIKDASTGGTFTYSAINYQTLHLVNVLCADNFVALTSPDFQTLTQHSICTEHGGLANVNGYQKLANPPLALSAPPPLAINGCSTALPCSKNSNAIDTFFVNFYLGTGVPTGSAQYGFSWINGDGVSVNQSIFALTQPRYDTLAHEIGHALALNHTNFGATSLSATNNLMLLGGNRATSYNPGCEQLTGNFSSSPLIYNNGVLFDLDYSTKTFMPCTVNGLENGAALADQLVLQSELVPPATSPVCPSPLDPTTCFTQQGAAALSPFINQTAPNTANAGGGAVFTSMTTTSTTSTTSTPSSGGTGTPAPLQFTISVGTAGASNAGIPDLVSSIIALLPSDQLSFNGNMPVTQIGGTPKTTDPTKPCDANHLNNCAVQVTSVTKLTNQQVTGNPGCDSGTGQPPSSQCVRVTYSTGPGFGPDNPAFNPNNNPPIFVLLAVSFNKDAGVILQNNLLAGAQYTAIDSNGFATTTRYGNVTGTAPNQFFPADSQHPDLTTPNVLLSQSNFQNASAVSLGPVLSKCTPPYTTVFEKIKGKLVPVQVCPDGNLPDGGE
jgi:hypothetical protein